MIIDELYKKILQIDKWVNYRPEELYKKFSNILSLPWFKKVEDIDEYLPLDELAKKLYKIKLY